MCTIGQLWQQAQSGATAGGPAPLSLFHSLPQSWDAGGLPWGQGSAAAPPCSQACSHPVAIPAHVHCDVDAAGMVALTAAAPEVRIKEDPVREETAFASTSVSSSHPGVLVPSSSPHVHSAACHPQLHLQFATPRALHDHTMPLRGEALQAAATHNSALLFIHHSQQQQQQQQYQNAMAVFDPSSDPSLVPGSLSHAPAAHASSSFSSVAASSCVPCVRIYPSHAAGRFHPYLNQNGATPLSPATPNHSLASGSDALSLDGGGGGVSAVLSSPCVSLALGPSLRSSAAPSTSNCHQCKVKKLSELVVHCTAVQHITVRRSTPLWYTHTHTRACKQNRRMRIWVLGGASRSACC